MKFNRLLFVLSIFILPAFATGQGFYDVSSINKVEIFFEQANWDSILHEYWRAADEKRLVGQVIINGQTFDSVGIRYKGYSSYDKDYAKKPLNIKLDHILTNQSLNGTETIKLSNGFRDPSLIREILGYEILKKYMPASQANFANVYINDEYYGIYSNPENVDKDFVEQHFNENDGVFIKGAPTMAPGGHALTGKADLVYKGEDSVAYYRSYELKSDIGWSDLIELCDIINNKPWEIENVLNVDRALWLLAFHNLFVSLDSPLAAPRNFYLYKDLNHKFNIIPWDLNMVFGTYRLIDGTWDNDLETIQQLDPLYHDDSTEFPFVKALLQNTRYRKMYLAHMRTILDENVKNSWYLQQAEEIQNIIDADAQTDTKMFFTYEEFLQNINQTVMDDTRVLVGITELMEGRKEFLNNHALFQYVLPSIKDININSDSFKIDSTIVVSCTVENGDAVQFVWRTNVLEGFTRSGMYDNGQSGDGAPNDQVYGVTLKPGSNKLQYYIYSDNTNAAKFSPERAEHEFYTITIQPDLVINEILARNNTIQADQNGEFDDWIELYNNSDTDISLSGYYLSDNATKLLKWQFPDTAINAHQYIIIWADENGMQPGLHANFKLSADGEVLFLVDSTQAILDEIKFGPQVTDISMGRFPNGTGNFYQLIPSYESKNMARDPAVIDNTTLLLNQFELFQNYPNPFNPVTTISWQLAVGSYVELSVFNTLGQEIESLVSQNLTVGAHQVQWNVSHLASGVYYYQLIAGEYRSIKKMIVLK